MTGRQTKDEGRKAKHQGTSPSPASGGGDGLSYANDSDPEGAINCHHRLESQACDNPSGLGWGLVLVTVALAAFLLAATTWGSVGSAPATALAEPPLSAPRQVGVTAGIVNLHMSNTPYGPPVTQFPGGTTIVYVVFDYYDTANTPIQVRVYSPSGPPAIFDQTTSYSTSGTASVSVSYNFPPSPPPTYYVTNVYLEDNPTPADSVQWWVAGSAGTPTPTPPVSPGAICALVYEDANGNQTWDTGEFLLAGAVITLTDASRVPLHTYTTDGRHEPHCFLGLLPGYYYVLEQNPPNYSESTTGDTLLLTVASGVTQYAEFGDRIPVVPTETPTLIPTPTATATPTRTTTPTHRLFLPLILKTFQP